MNTIVVMAVVGLMSKLCASSSMSIRARARRRGGRVFARWMPIVVMISTLMSERALADVIFSQRVDSPEIYDSSAASDHDALDAIGTYLADDVTLALPSVARSVTWWGTLSHSNTPVMPVSFDLVFYTDDNGVPNTNNMISSTAVSFASLEDTGSDLYGDNIYEFRADLMATPLPAGTQVWFSVVANTTNDADDDFLWRFDEDGTAAYWSGFGGGVSLWPNTSMSFVLDDAPVPIPEPPPSLISAINCTTDSVLLNITNLVVGSTNYVLQTDTVGSLSWSTSGMFIAGSTSTNWSAVLAASNAFYRIKSGY